MRTLKINLDNERKNAIIPTTGILQGNANIKLEISLFESGMPLVVADDDKPIIIFRFSSGSESIKLEDGEHDYDLVTVANGKILIDANKYMVRGYGTATLRILLNDLYTFETNYTVNKNEDYIQEPVTVKSQGDLAKKDLSNVDDSVLENKMQGSFAKVDLSNADVVKSAEDGRLLYVKDGKLDQSAIKETADKIILDKDLETPSDSVFIGENVVIHDEGGFLGEEVLASGRNYIVMDYEFDKATGTKRPVYWERGPRQSNVVKQADDSVVMNNVTEINLGTDNEERYSSDIYFNFNAPVTNFCMQILANGKVSKYVPTKALWVSGVSGLNLGTGVQKISLGNGYSRLKDYDIQIKIKADQPINLKGNGTVPYWAVDENIITRKEVALKEDITGGGTSSTIEDILRNGDDANGQDIDNVGRIGVKPTLDKRWLANTDDVGSIRFTDQDNHMIMNVQQDGQITTDTFDSDAVNAEINRLKTDITPSNAGALPVYAWRGRGVPTIPNDKPYRAYYIHAIVLPDNAQRIVIPTNAPNGASFSIENNDRSNYLTLVPPAGETINSGKATYQCASDTLNFFVKQGNDWVLAFGGIFPNSITSMMSTIEANLPSGTLNTIDEIKAQLKDRLHTFREIQNEFASQLHTDGEIGTIVDTAGFIKGVEVNDQKSNFFLDQKSISFGVGFTATQDPNDNTEVKIDLDGGVGSNMKFKSTDGSEFNSMQMDAPMHDIEINEKTNPDGTKTAELMLSPTLSNSKRNPGVFNELGRSLDINSKFPKAKLYFSYPVVKGDGRVYKDMKDKAVIVQDISQTDDPNISGGTTFFTACLLVPDDNIENTFTQDGYVEIELLKTDGTAITDINGNPMGVIKHYKSGQKMQKELYYGEFKAIATTKVFYHITLHFPNQEVITLDSSACEVFQSITKDEKSGDALEAFMDYTGLRFDFSSRWYGDNSLNLARTLIFNQPKTTLNDETLHFGDNLYISSVGKTDVEINNYHLIISDNSDNLPVFSITKLFDRIDTFFNKNNDIKSSVTITDKDDAFDVALLKYTNTKDVSGEEYPQILSYNVTPVFTNGWTVVDTSFISEDVVSGDHTAEHTFTIPTDATKFALVFYPNNNQSSMMVKLKDWEGDFTTQSSKMLIKSNFHESEQGLKYDESKYIFETKTPKGVASFRYTVNDTDTRIPFGVLHSEVNGDNSIENDDSWHSGGNTWACEGNGKFMGNGVYALIKYQSERIFNEQGVETNNEFWLAKNGVKLPDTSTVFTVPANADKPISVVSNGDLSNNGTKLQGYYKIPMAENDIISVHAKSSIPDGFYLQSNTDGVPLFEIDIDYVKLSETEKALMDRLNTLEQSADEIDFMDGDTQVYDKKLQYEVNTNKMKVVTK